MMGGSLCAISEDNKIIAFEISFANQNSNFAPALGTTDEEGVKAHIIDRDKLLPFVKMQLEEAFSYLQCYFDIELASDEIEASYIGETDEEEKIIPIKSFKVGRISRTPTIPYDMFTRAIMAAEAVPAPRLEANFVKMARTEMFQERYIDSFRYSFLLIESIYGDGKFKSEQLKNALKKNTAFVATVSVALQERMLPKRDKWSDTAKLLSEDVTVESVIDHFVDKRGFYFHGNTKRKDPWQPHEQQAAESLCLLSFCVANQIALDAASSMFDESLSKRHVENARSTGAIMTMKVSYRFQEQGEDFDREGVLNMTVPGTKATPKLAVYVANNFLKYLQEKICDADLKSAKCVVEETGQSVFHFEVHV